MLTSLADHKTGLHRSLYQLKRTGRSDQFAQLTTFHTTCTYDTPTEPARTMYSTRCMNVSQGSQGITTPQYCMMGM